MKPQKPLFYLFWGLKSKSVCLIFFVYKNNLIPLERFYNLRNFSISSSFILVWKICFVQTNKLFSISDKGSNSFQVLLWAKTNCSKIENRSHLLSEALRAKTNETENLKIEFRLRKSVLWLKNGENFANSFRAISIVTQKWKHFMER